VTTASLNVAPPPITVHAQIGSGQSVIVKWASAHYYTYYVSVVPAKYQSHLYGTEGSNLSPLKEYQGILEDYVALAPEGANTAFSNPRVHGLFSVPTKFSDEGKYLPACSNGWCPDDLYGDRIMPEDDAWISHENEASAALYHYNQTFILEDKRVSYDSAKYPWLRSVSKFVQPVNLHSDFDIIEQTIIKQEGDGEHFLVHWFLDLGSKRTFYADVMDGT